MARGWKILATTVVVAAAGGILYAWLRPSRDVSKDLEPGYVNQLTVTTGGKPLPKVIRSGETHPVVVRLQIPSARDEDSYLALFMVVGPNGYEHGGRPDIMEAFLQSRARDAPGVSLTVVRDGRVVDLTPKPPAVGDPFQQYCALFDSQFFKKNGAASGPLELHLWLYPRITDPKSGTKTDSKGHLVFIHDFQFERAAGN